MVRQGKENSDQSDSDSVRASRSRIPTSTPKSPLIAMSQTGGGRGGKATTGGDIQKVLDRLDTIEVSLQTKIDASIQSQEFTAKQLTDKIKKVEDANEQARAKYEKLEESDMGIKAQLKVQGTRLHEIEDRIEQLERERRRNILVIDGLEEKEGERAEDVMSRILGDLKVDYTVNIYTAIFRRGKAPSNNKTGGTAAVNNNRQGAGQLRPRPLVVVFPSGHEKSAIFRNLRNLQGKDEWNRVYFNDDLTETQANEQRDLRALAAYAKSKGYNARVKAGNLLLDSRSFRHQDIVKLPHDISLAKAKTLYILDDKAVVFQSQHSPLSNLYPCNIIYRGEVFLSTEAAFQFTRAKTCGYEREAQLMKTERRAFKVKLIARDIKSTREWEEMSEQVMREILLEKFKRNKLCAQALLATGERVLLEGTGDRKWGCGIPISKADQITFKNPGRNLLGHLLEEIRRVLKQGKE